MDLALPLLLKLVCSSTKKLMNVIVKKVLVHLPLLYARIKVHFVTYLVLYNIQLLLLILWLCPKCPMPANSHKGN